MVWRENRLNNTRFMGCVNFPQCRGSRNEDGIAKEIANAGEVTRIQRLLKAAVLASETECLTFSEADLQCVDQYELHINSISEENAYVVTVEKK